ncbi:MAG TPA: PA2779 family protein [Gammaproteobacteria bacterium]
MRQPRAALRRSALALTAVFGFMSLAVPVAQAGLVSTGQYAAPAAAAGQRAQVEAFLQRADVQAQLVALGVDPRAAQARVDALSEAELARAADLAAQPAGASAAGAIVFIFVVLLITDIAGLTDVFTFVRK